MRQALSLKHPQAAVFTTVETDREAPSTPANVTAGDITRTGAAISWDASTDNVGVTGYDIYVNGKKVNEELIQETAYALTELTQDTDYEVAVYALDEKGKPFRGRYGILQDSKSICRRSCK